MGGGRRSRRSRSAAACLSDSPSMRPTASMRLSTRRSGDPGIWRVSSARDAPVRIATLDPTGFPNGLAFDRQGDLFVTDSSLGTIWRIPRFGGAATAWLSSPLLAGDPSLSGIGANGIAFWHGDVYVANSDQMSIVRVPVNRNGSAGTPRVYVADPSIGFADGIAFDARGGLTSRVPSPRTRWCGSRQTERSSCLRQPLTDSTTPRASHSGHPTRDRTKLYFTNAGINFGTPSVMTADVGVAGNLEGDR